MRRKIAATVMSLLAAGVILAACDGGTTDDTDRGTETTLPSSQLPAADKHPRTDRAGRPNGRPAQF